MIYGAAVKAKIKRNQTLGKNKGRSLKNEGKQGKIFNDSQNGQIRFGQGSQIDLKSVGNQRTAKSESEPDPDK